MSGIFSKLWDSWFQSPRLTNFDPLDQQRRLLNDFAAEQLAGVEQQSNMAHQLTELQLGFKRTEEQTYRKPKPGEIEAALESHGRWLAQQQGLRNEFVQQQQGALQGVGLGAGLGVFGGSPLAGLPQMGPLLGEPAAVKPTSPPFPWSCVWFYVWRVGAGVAWGLWWWLFNVWVK